MRKLLSIILLVCFLLGMATRRELENVKKEAETTTTAETTIESEGTEKYVPKVIIEAEWGDGPGEFGFEADPDVPPAGIGPCGLTVDDAKLYVLDAVNRRINVYSTEGSFVGATKLKRQKLPLGFFNPGFTSLARDSEGDFYLLGYDSGGSKILKFDSVGNFVKELCKSPVDEEFLRAPLSLPPPLLRKKERRDSLGVLLGSYKTRGVEAPFNLKAEYDSLDCILKNFRSQIKRKEPLRIAFTPEGLKVKGNSLIVAVEERGFLYSDKNSGRILKERDRIKGIIKRWSYFGNYPEVIRNGIGLSKDLREFVLNSRYNTSTISATDFDKEGNFYELLWKPYGKYLEVGVKVIKWEKVQ